MGYISRWFDLTAIMIVAARNMTSYTFAVAPVNKTGGEKDLPKAVSLNEVANRINEYWKRTNPNSPSLEFWVNKISKWCSAFMHFVIKPNIFKCSLRVDICLAFRAARPTFPLFERRCRTHFSAQSLKPTTAICRWSFRLTISGCSSPSVSHSLSRIRNGPRNTVTRSSNTKAKSNCVWNSCGQIWMTQKSGRNSLPKSLMKLRIAQSQRSPRSLVSIFYILERWITGYLNWPT